MNIITIKALHIGSKNPGPWAEYEAEGAASNVAYFVADTVEMVMNVAPNWSSEPAYGKMDAIPFYSNTTRTVQYSFLCQHNKKKNYTADIMALQVDKLQKFQYPRYSGADGFEVISAAPFFTISFKKVDSKKNGETYKLIEEVDGYISSDLSIAPGHAGAGGEAVAPLPVNGIMYERAFKISFTLTVLHRRVPGWNNNDWVGPSFWSAAANGTKTKASPAPTNPDNTKNEESIGTRRGPETPSQRRNGRPEPNAERAAGRRGADNN